MRTTRLAKEKKICSGLNLMPWILWGKLFFFFCLVQQFKQPMFQTSVQKTSRRIRRTTPQTLATAYYQQPAIIISALASCVALMIPRSSFNYQVVGGTSIIFAICYPDQCRITKQDKLIYRAAQRMQEPRAANSLDEEDAAKATLCCLLPPFPQSCHSHYLLYWPASSFETTHADFIK